MALDCKKQNNIQKTVPSENTCVMCGAIIPEGRMVCCQCTLSVENNHPAYPWDIRVRNNPKTGQARKKRLFQK